MIDEVRGYKPHMVEALLGVTKERFRYWRKHLDPKPVRSHFTFSDIFAYRIMKSFIFDRREDVAFLSTFDWSALFNEIAEIHYSELREMVIFLDEQAAKMRFEYLNNFNDNRSNKLCFIYLDQLVEDQFTAFVELGTQNVVSINHAKKA